MNKKYQFEVWRGAHGGWGADNDMVEVAENYRGEYWGYDDNDKIWVNKDWLEVPDNWDGDLRDINAIKVNDPLEFELPEEFNIEILREILEMLETASNAHDDVELFGGGFYKLVEMDENGKPIPQ